MEQQELATFVREQFGAINEFMTGQKKDFAEFREQSRKDKMGIDAELLKLRGMPVSVPHRGSNAISDVPFEQAGNELVTNKELSAWVNAPRTGRSELALDLPFRHRGRFIGKAATPVMSGAPPQPVPGVIGPKQPALRLAELLPMIPIPTGAVIFSRETSFTSGAEIVPEGTLKPASALAYENVTVTAQVIATIAKMTLQAYSDQPALAEWLGARMTYAVLKRTEEYLLNAPAVGLIANASTLDPAYAPVAPATALDAVAAALSQLEALGYTPTGIVMNGVDVAAARRLKDDNGVYTWVTPDSNIGTASVWNTPLIISPSMAPGTFLVGDFAASTALFMRESVKVDVSFENEADFVENLCTFRAEQRAALAVLVAQGLVKGSLTVTP